MTGQGTIVATGSIAYPVGPREHRRRDRGREGHDDDVRPTTTASSRAPSPGRFLAVVEELPAGRARLLRATSSRARRVSSGRRRRRPPRRRGRGRGRARPRRAAPRRPTRRSSRRCRPRRRCSRPTAPTGTSRRASTRSGPSPRATRRSTPSRSASPPELMAKIPAHILRMYVPGATLADALPHLRETYCGPIAYEIEHIASHRQRVWLREKIESGAFRKPLTAEEKKALLKRLTEVDALERFMHKAYLGQKQFSIEGLDMTVPMLDELIQLAAGAGRAGGRHRHGPPRAAQRARAQPRPPLRHDLRRVRGRLHARGRDDDPAGRHRRRQVPPRRRGLLPAAGGDLDQGRAWSRNPTHLEYVVAGGHGRRARRADDAARGRTPTATPTPRSRSSCTATPPSPARASWPRRSTSRRSTATRSAAAST